MTKEIMLSVILGAIFGIPVGFVGWWIVSKIVANIQISRSISVIIDPSNGQKKYRIKVFNNGRRAAFDFHIVAEIRFPSKNIMLPNNTQLMRVGINTVPLAYLDKKSGRTMNFKTEEIPKTHRRHLLPEIQERIDNNERIPLDELLVSLGDQARLRVYVMCNDAVSGARRLYKSKDFSINDITNKRFAPNSADILSGGPE